MWLSVTLLFNQLTSGQDVLLQGMQIKILGQSQYAGRLLV
jgi:hypothetical protein